MRCYVVVMLLLVGCVAQTEALPTFFVAPTQADTQIPDPTKTLTATPTPSLTSTVTATYTATATLSATLIQTPTITKTTIPTLTDISTPVSPLELDFESVYPLQLELRKSVKDALETYRHLLPDNHLTVTAYRYHDGWAKITLLPAFIIENQWRNIEDYSYLAVNILAEQQGLYAWDTYLLHSELASPAVPERFIDIETEPVPLAGEYRFPWAAGQGWWATAGWHDGNALDFQPAPGSSSAVLAAESGYLTELCRDGYQSLLMIAHADGRRTYYLHVQVGDSVRANYLDRNVQRGQLLGRLIRRVPFNYACGRGGSSHLHFIVSDRAMQFQGMALADIAANAQCCQNPPIFVSTNQRIDPE